MNPLRLWAIFLRQFYLLRGNASRWVVIFFWTTMELLIWGFMTIYLNRIGGDTFNFLTVLIAAVIFESIMGRAQAGVSIASLEDVWTRNFINFFATPLTIFEYVAGVALTGIFTTVAAAIGMSLVAWLLFDYTIFHFGLALVPFLFILLLFGFSLGLIAISIVIRFGPSAETFAWIIPTLLSPFVGVFYPVETLPQVMQWVGNAFPVTYVFESMRSIVLTGSYDPRNILIGLLLSAAYLIVSYLILIRYFRLAFKKGLFVRFMTDAW